MAEVMQIYRCNICGNLIEVFRAGVGQLVCCGELMERLEAKTEDKGYEKHVPVIEKTGAGVLVKIGEVPHPMEEKHYIEWIEVIYDGMTQRKSLEPGMAPEAEFCVDADRIEVRQHCNIHSLWKKEEQLG